MKVFKQTPGISNGVGGKMGEIDGKGQVKEFVKAEHLQLTPSKSQNVKIVSTPFDIKKSEPLL